MQELNRRTTAMSQVRTCATEQCTNKTVPRGTRCSKCVYKKQYHGSFDYKRPRPIDVFLSRVNKTESCWLWTSWKNTSGYGMMHYKGKDTVASRLSWIFHHGEIPDGMFVLHKCDVPACVNPEHLFLGNHQENMEDMCKKGRRAYGNRKLTDSNVIEIKKLLAQGDQNLTIAKQFNIDPSTVSNIRHGKHWRKLG